MARGLLNRRGDRHGQDVRWDKEDDMRRAEDMVDALAELLAIGEPAGRGRRPRTCTQLVMEDAAGDCGRPCIITTARALPAL